MRWRARGVGDARRPPGLAFRTVQADQHTSDRSERVVGGLAKELVPLWRRMLLGIVERDKENGDIVRHSRPKTIGNDFRS
jgi:hypothetical protein